MRVSSTNLAVKETSREMEPLNETDVVIYHVLITDTAPNAWYKDAVKAKFDCILDIVDRPFNRGQMIKFKVMGAFYPVKYILLQHCQVLSQRMATHKEVTAYYSR